MQCIMIASGQTFGHHKRIFCKYSPFNACGYFCEVIINYNWLPGKE